MFGLFKKKEIPVNDTQTVTESAVVPATPEKKQAEIDAAEAKVQASLVPRDVFVPPPGMEPGTPSHIPGFDFSPVDPDEEFRAKGGSPLADGVDVATEEAIVDALQTVYDPEIPVNIYDLGLIYKIDIAENGEIKIDMSLTAPGCPVAGEMPGMVARAVEEVEGTGEIEVLLVWDPAWSPELMSEDAKLALGMG
jgi:FeS assembly SUF system protein